MALRSSLERIDASAALTDSHTRPMPSATTSTIRIANERNVPRAASARAVALRLRAGVFDGARSTTRKCGLRAREAGRS